MSHGTCKLENCGGRVYITRRSICRAHYAHFRRRGIIDVVAPLERREPHPKQSCSREGCEFQKYAHKLCKRHYDQARKSGELGAKPCSVEGCQNYQVARTYCRLHYDRWKRHGDAEKLLDRPAHCTVAECTEPVNGRGLCRLHYGRWARHGDPEGGYRRYAKPEVAFSARTYWNGDCLEWSGTHTQGGYSAMTTSNERILVHRWIWEQHNGAIPDGLQIDHRCHNRGCVLIDHLRLVTVNQNLQNLVGPHRDNKAGIRGVYWADSVKGWRAQIRHNKKTYNLGTYSTKEEAGEVALQARLEYFTHNDVDRRPTSGECESAGQERLNADYLYDQ